MKLLPKTFRFSWKITIICAVLALIMIRCSVWQWDRYGKKVELVKTYEEQSSVEPIEVTPSMLERIEGGDEELLLSLKDRKVRVRGRFDFEHQFISTNKKHASGPGHWLLAPLRVEADAGSEPARAVIISRGFIPFANRAAESWKRYDTKPEEIVSGVLKLGLKPMMFGPTNPEAEAGPFAHVWYYEEIDKMAAQLPYPTATKFYIQRLGKSDHGDFPAQAVSIEVPPSTHFGYTIEWALLALATIVVGFVLQAFPWYTMRQYGMRGRERQLPDAVQHP